MILDDKPTPATVAPPPPTELAPVSGAQSDAAVARSFSRKRAARSTAAATPAPPSAPVQGNATAPAPTAPPSEPADAGDAAPSALLTDAAEAPLSVESVSDSSNDPLTGPAADDGGEPVTSPLLRGEVPGEMSAASSPTSGLPPEVEAALAELRGGKSAREVAHRIHDVVRERNAAREALAVAEARAVAAEAKSAQQAAPPPGPVPPEIQAVDREIRDNVRAMAILQRHPNGGMLTDELGREIKNPDGSIVELTPEQVSTELVATNTRLSELNVRRMEAHVQSNARLNHLRSSAEAEAVRLYPWLNQPGAEEYKVAEQVLERYPGLRHTPEFPLLLGQLVEGHKREKQLRSALLRPAAARPRSAPAPVVTHAPAAQPPVNGNTSKLKQAQAQFVKSGSVADLAAKFAEQRRARRALP